MKRSVSLFVLFSFSLFVVSCVKTQKNKLLSVKAAHGKLLDSNGEELVLKGLNIMDKDSANGYFEGVDQAAFDSIKSWGMNAVRLGIFWAAVEPQPGKIDEDYLKALDARIAMAEKAGLYVLLDMHQDLYSEKYNGDGAPDWACLDEGNPHTVLGGSWDDAYFTSPAIHTAFDNFWKNKEAEDGIGLQDHYAQAWAAVAQRYAQNPTVIGYDLMNEPFIGSPIIDVQKAYFKVLSEAMEVENEEELMGSWMTEDGRASIMENLRDTTLYKKVMDVTEPFYAQYETEYLQPFYERVFDAIKAVDAHTLLFLEPSVSVNIGVKSHLKNTFDDRMVYAPHVYDIVTDTDQSGAYSLERLSLIIRRIKEHQEILNTPVAVGEWGAFYGADERVIPQGNYILQEFDKLGWSNFYWSYFPRIQENAYFSILKDQNKDGLD